GGGKRNKADDASLGAYENTTGSVGSYSFSDHVGGEIDVPPSVKTFNSGICAYATNGCGTNYCPPPPTIPSYCPGVSDTWTSAPTRPLNGPFVARTSATGGCNGVGSPCSGGSAPPAGYDRGICNVPSAGGSLGLPGGT